MRLKVFIALACGLLALGTNLNAASVIFNTDPFAGTNASDPGRQVVGGPGTEIPLDVANDTFFFDPAVFGVTSFSFANDLVESLPPTGINFIVVRNTGTQFGAGSAHNLLAAQFTSPTPGFFVYFNTNPNLNVARLVYSPDLSDPDADLAILARLSNFGGQAGFNALPTITAANFAPVPEPSSMLLVSGGMLVCGYLARRRRR